METRLGLQQARRGINYVIIPLVSLSTRLIAQKPSIDAEKKVEFRATISIRQTSGGKRTIHTVYIGDLFLNRFLITRRIL